MHIQIDRVFTTVSRNLGLEDYSRYVDNWIEWSYEAEKLIWKRSSKYKYCKIMPLRYSKEIINKD